jgi:hypothetical protein
MGTSCVQRCGNCYLVDAACGSVGLLVALVREGMAQAVPFLHNVVLSEQIAAWWSSGWVWT